MKQPRANVLELPLVERAETAREGFTVYVLCDDEIVEISAEELRTRYPRNPQQS